MGWYYDELFVRVFRGSHAESCHRVVAVLASHKSEVIAAWGDPNTIVFPRSSLKPFQVLPLIESGAAQHYRLSGQEIALACGSHGGTVDQVNLINGWLFKLGITEAVLGCGSQWPRSDRVADEVKKKGQVPSALFNTCSGKHLGMITTAMYLRQPLEKYLDPDHIIQRTIRGVLSELSHFRIVETMTAVDGCGAPTYAMPIKHLAYAASEYRGMGRHGNKRSRRQQAIAHVQRCIRAYPDMLSWSGDFDAEATCNSNGELFLKSGAEGVAIVMLPRQKLGMAVKVIDGAKRAADYAVMTLLEHLRLLNSRTLGHLWSYVDPRIYNAKGEVTGSLSMTTLAGKIAPHVRH